ncbi:hypothetical protein [uncultured Jannaschia sp.]|uniref:hypothetical protein n=1 Tax=uncultured Jannaschia sp. TaxID=293347 RepID=UPI00260F5F85|nr:hypothetical protein [uncultured Jannaschia sp.]
MRPWLPLVLLAGPAFGDVPVIERAEAVRLGTGWRFDVTVRHADAGWDHYADGWTILTETGGPLAHRELLHPHDDEQPFTRSLSGVAIPDGTERVILRAHDTVHGWSVDHVLTLPEAP